MALGLALSALAPCVMHTLTRLCMLYDHVTPAHQSRDRSRDRSRARSVSCQLVGGRPARAPCLRPRLDLVLISMTMRPSWRPSGWRPNKATAAANAGRRARLHAPSCFPLQARVTTVPVAALRGKGEACPALREASHIAPRPPPSYTVRRHVTSATSPPPRRGRKAAGVMLDGRPSSIFRCTQSTCVSV